MLNNYIRRLIIQPPGLVTYCMQCGKEVQSPMRRRIHVGLSLSRIMLMSVSSHSTSTIVPDTKGKKGPEWMNETLEPAEVSTESEQGATSESDSDGDPRLPEEFSNYELGKRWLATMMGEDVENFTENKIQAAIRYLLPSHLTAPDAKPMYKHPSLIYPRSKEDLFARSGRPIYAGFYTGEPNYHDLIYDIFKHMDKLNAQDDLDSSQMTHSLPSGTVEGDIKVRWANHREMQIILDEEIDENQYNIVLRRLNKLAANPDSYKIQDFLQKYQKPVSSGGKNIQIQNLDEDGCSIAMGYRKSSMAEVKIKEGSGNVVVNDRPLTDYFKRLEDRQQLLFPFLVIDQVGRYDVEASVIGGGTTGQCGAIRLGISRALLNFSDSYWKPLDEAGLLLQDPRRVERKKPGRKKARKKFAWVRR